MAIPHKDSFNYRCAYLSPLCFSMYTELAAKNTLHCTLDVTVGFMWDLVKGGSGMSGEIQCIWLQNIANL